MKDEILQIAYSLEKGKIDEGTAKRELCVLLGVMRCYVKEIDQFYKDTGYSDNTNRFGVRKDNKREGGWDWNNPSQMIKDWMKWKRNKA
tara:strand:+ start:219 stop:485 length:267 start_codon:yes stop_codon:yes gene_type:complete